ncbi:MAG: arginine--tRNA ligase [Clostridia bacterium]|nr:arginine--tRNA ligase [Clostridia bacterium]
MDEIKKIIIDSIKKVLENDEIQVEEYIEKPKDSSMGDFAFPCFKLASVYKRSPMEIAKELYEKLTALNLEGVGKIEAVGAYINFFADSNVIASQVISKVLSKGEEYLKSDLGKGKTVCIDYSSPNIAKPFHIGHLRTTIIGAALYNLYKALGYRTVGINHLGDYGTQFGYVIEGYKRWKDEYDLDTEPIKSLVSIYVRISALAKEDESVIELARENFAKLEQGDKETVELWSKFRELSIKEYKRIYEKLDIEFDSYNGEAFYNDKMDEIVDILEQKQVLTESEGAKVVNLKKEKVPCMILKSNGSTTYATRDLAAVLFRKREYDFEKCIYVTGGEQMLHFKQVFEVAEHIVGKDVAQGLVHVPFGMVLGSDGKKFSTRKGASATIEGVLDEAIEKSRETLIQKGKDVEIEETAKKIGIGAVIFNDLKNSRIKDEVFDLDDMLKFEGETGPYVQYTFVRTNSILEKAGGLPSQVNASLLKEKEELELIKKIADLENVMKQAAEEYEPSVLTRYVIEVATLFSKFYNECQVIVEDEELKNARLALVYSTGVVIKGVLGILGIKCPDKM